MNIHMSGKGSFSSETRIASSRYQSGSVSSRQKSEEVCVCECVCVGLWSSIWVKRVLDWDSHVERSVDYRSLSYEVRDWRGQNWLMSQRLRFVSDVGIGRNGRNRPDAGRLGARMSGGKPAPRWHEGIALAKE